MTRNTTVRRSFFLNLLVLVSAALLAACGSDKKAPPPVVNAEPTGYYGTSGTGINSTADVFEDDNTASLSIANVQGMVHNGRFIMMSLNSTNSVNPGPMSYDGPITVSGNNFSGSSVSIYRNGLLIGTAPVTGTITQGSTITGTLSGSGAGRGTFTLNYSPKNSEAAALNIVGTTWPGLIGGSTSIFNLTVNGTTGALASNATTDGVFQACTLAVGSVMTPVSGQHLYTVSLTFSGCNTGAANGTYTGLATTRNPTDNNMPFAVSKGTYSIHSNF